MTSFWDPVHKWICVKSLLRRSKAILCISHSKRCSMMNIFCTQLRPAQPRTDRFQCKPRAQWGGVCLLHRQAHLETHHPAGQGECRPSCAGCRQLQAWWRGGGMESSHPGSSVVLHLVTCMLCRWAMAEVTPWPDTMQLRELLVPKNRGHLSLAQVLFHLDWTRIRQIIF